MKCGRAREQETQQDGRNVGVSLSTRLYMCLNFKYNVTPKSHTSNTTHTPPKGNTSLFLLSKYKVFSNSPAQLLI